MSFLNDLKYIKYNLKKKNRKISVDDKERFLTEFKIKHGCELDKNDDVFFPLFLELEEINHNTRHPKKIYNFESPETARTYVYEKNKLHKFYFVIAMVVFALGVSLLCYSIYESRPHKTYENFIKNAEIKVSRDGRYEYIMLKDQNNIESLNLGFDYIKKDSLIFIIINDHEKDN